MSVERAPYVVSSDAFRLMRDWSNRTGFKSPDKSFFLEYEAELGQKLHDYFGTEVDIIDEGEIRNGLKDYAAVSRYPIISIDRVYVDDTFPNLIGYIDMTRTVGEDFNDLPGVHPRLGYPDLEVQIQRFKSEKQQDVVLLDDVIFTGGGMLRLAEILAKVNCRVAGVIGGIGIANSLEVIRDAGIDVHCVRQYEEVIDEVCERDFVACSPMSGRAMRDTEGNYWSAPYMKPFGDPGKWASIPVEHVADFSEFCLKSSVRVWKEVERLSREEVPTSVAPRQIRGLNNNGSVASALSQHLLQKV